MKTKTAFGSRPAGKYILRLFVAGATERSRQAVSVSAPSFMDSMSMR